MKACAHRGRCRCVKSLPRGRTDLENRQADALLASLDEATEAVAKTTGLGLFFVELPDGTMLYAATATLDEAAGKIVGASVYAGQEFSLRHVGHRACRVVMVNGEVGR